MAEAVEFMDDAAILIRGFGSHARSVSREYEACE